MLDNAMLQRIIMQDTATLKECERKIKELRLELIYYDVKKRQLEKEIKLAKELQTYAEA